MRNELKMPTRPARIGTTSATCRAIGLASVVMNPPMSGPTAAAIAAAAPTSA
jgi:hypothetical protein